MTTTSRAMCLNRISMFGLLSELPRDAPILPAVITQVSDMTYRDRLLKFIDIQPCVVQGEPDAHNVFLQVTNQRFTVTPYACETKEMAEWTRDMLVVALEKIVTDCTLGEIDAEKKNA